MSKLYSRRNAIQLGGALLATAGLARSTSAETGGADMTGETGITVVRSLIQSFFNAHDPSVAARYFTPDFHWHGGSVGEYKGVESYAKAMSGFWSALPDAHATELDAFEAGDRVTMRFLVEATHKGALWGIPATGSRVRWDAVMIYRMQGNKIAEQWAAEDWCAILRDLKVFDPPFGKG